MAMVDIVKPLFLSWRAYY